MFGRKKRNIETLCEILEAFISASHYDKYSPHITSNAGALGMAIAYANGASYSYAEPLGLSVEDAAKCAFKVFCAHVAEDPILLYESFRSNIATIPNDETVAFAYILGGIIAAKFSMRDEEFVNIFADLMTFDRPRIIARLNQMENKYNFNFDEEFRDPEARYAWLGR